MDGGFAHHVVERFVFVHPFFAGEGDYPEKSIFIINKVLVFAGGILFPKAAIL